MIRWNRTSDILPPIQTELLMFREDCGVFSGCYGSLEEFLPEDQKEELYKNGMSEEDMLSINFYYYDMSGNGILELDTLPESWIELSKLNYYINTYIMFVLRKITPQKIEENFVIGGVYSLIQRRVKQNTDSEEFKSVYFAFHGEGANIPDNVYAVLTGSLNQDPPYFLEKENEYYIMSTDGRTFSNISYKN